MESPREVLISPRFPKLPSIPAARSGTRPVHISLPSATTRRCRIYRTVDEAERGRGMTHPRPRPSAGSAAYGETGTPLSGQINDFRVRGVLLNRCDALLGAVDEMVVMVAATWARLP